MPVKLTRNRIEALRPKEGGGSYVVYDLMAPGLGVRVSQGGTRTFVLRYYADGKDRRMSLGTYGSKLSLDQARKLAKRTVGRVANGENPAQEKIDARRAATVQELFERFDREHTRHKAPATQRSYRMLWNRYVLPAWKNRRVEDIVWRDVARLHRAMADKPFVANRMLALVSKAWNLASRWQWVPQDRRNPAEGHDKYPERRRGQCLSPSQLRAVGDALDAEPNLFAAQAMRATMLTGLRPAEIYKLRWEEVDLERRILRLKASKTGPRVGYLGLPAAQILHDLPRLSEQVFPGGDIRRPLSGIASSWKRVRSQAELPAGIRFYDASRHTFASMAAALHVPREFVKMLIGHSSGDVTDLYTHLPPESVLPFADRVSEHVDQLMRGRLLDSTPSPARLSPQAD